MGLLSYWRTAVNVLLLVVLAAALWRADAVQKRFDAAQLAREREIAAANVAAREQENKMNEQMAQARKEFDDELQKRDVAYGKLRTESDRLRFVLAERGHSTDTRAAARTDAGIEAERLVLGQCVNEYEKMARDADELNSRLSIAQKWARTVR